MLATLNRTASHLLKRPIDIGGIILPSSLSGLELWDEISTDNVIKDGSNNISQISDISGNGRHATQGTLSNQFLFVNNIVNGKPIARSNGASNTYSFDGTFFQNVDITIISVQKRSAGGQNIIIGANTRNNVVRWEYAGDSFIRLTTRAFGGPTQASTATCTTYAGGSEPFRVMAVTFDNVNGTTFYEDGVVIGGSATHTVRNANNNVARLGKYAGNQNQWFTGDFGLLLCFSRALNSSELTQMFNYCNFKYNIF